MAAYHQGNDFKNHLRDQRCCQCLVMSMGELYLYKTSSDMTVNVFCYKVDLLQSLIVC